jgi:hypothetical protein
VFEVIMTNSAFEKTVSAAITLAVVLTPTLASAGSYRGNNGNTWSDGNRDRGGDRRQRDSSSTNGYRYDSPRQEINSNYRHDSNRYADRRHTNSYYNSGHYNNSWRNPAWNNSRYSYGRNNSWFSSGWNNNYNYGYGHNNYYGGYRGNSKTDTVVLGVGLGILGLAVASAASNKSRNSRDWTDDNRQYVTSGRDAPRGFPEPAYDASLPTAYDSSCLQAREYQTTITVGGQREKAYGTACLQPDGSWRQGPPQLEQR